MTVDELMAREQIRDVIAKYAIAGDQLDIEAFVHTFAEHGVLEMPRECPCGRAAIRAWVTTTQPFGDETRRPTSVRHHITSSLIDFNPPDAPSARAYFVVLTDVGLDHSGYYVDRFGREDDQWLFAHRRVEFFGARSTASSRLRTCLSDKQVRPELASPLAKSGL